MAAAKSTKTKLPPTGRTGYDGIVRYPVQIFLTEAAIIKSEDWAQKRVWPNCRTRSAVCAKIVEEKLK